MGSELIPALAGVLGVCVGAAATLVAARITLRGSEAQAAAQREQAVAAYRAALDAAREQVRAATNQQARAARRPVYAAFLRSAHALADAVHDYVLDPESDAADYGRAFERARTAYADLELEGPEEIAALGRDFVNAAIDARERGSAYASVLIAADKVTALASSPGTTVLGRDVEQALRRVRAAARTVPPGWRGRVRGCWSRPDGWAAWEEERDRAPEGAVPADRVVAELFAALDAADEGAVRAAVEAGALARDQDVWRLYWAAVHWPDQEPAAYVRGLIAPVRQSARTFAAQARAALHVPEGPPFLGDGAGGAGSADA